MATEVYEPQENPKLYNGWSASPEEEKRYYRAYSVNPGLFTASRLDAQRQYELGKTLGSMIYQNSQNTGLERRAASQNLNNALTAQNVEGAQRLAGAENNLYGNQIANYNTRLKMSDAKAKSQAAGVGAGAQIGGSILALFSDETLKQDIVEITEFTKHTLGMLTPYMFHYKKEVGLPGQMVGIMAQDLEKSSIGKTIIDEVDGKKAVDMQKAVSFILAALADLNKRLEMAGM